MTQMLEANWLAFVLALLIGLAVAWWLFGRAVTPPKREHRPDVLDEGAAPAARNQALIDAPPAAVPPAVAPPAATILGGAGEAVSVGTGEVVEAAAQPAAQPTGEADDLRRIKGIGPKLVTTLNGLGVTRFDQIANWTDADLARIDGQLGSFAGRPARDNWVEQARLLSAGDTAAYEAKFGKL
jgi:predicted flap endonuclease-1-like 5' DNA nuclease